MDWIDKRQTELLKNGIVGLNGKKVEINNKKIKKIFQTF